MPQFSDHIRQVKRNLIFFETIHSSVKDCLDWQVTSLFYAAVHLINAHLSRFGQQYRNHNEVINAINFANTTSMMRVDEAVYLAYISLQNVSRKARYLIEVKDGKLSDAKAHYIFDKHLARALANLEVIMCYVVDKYSVELPQVQVDCPEFTHSTGIRYIKKKVAA